MNPWEPNDPTPPPTIIKHELNHLTGGVIVPGLQAAITGILLGLAALAITAWFSLPWLAIGGTVAAVTAAGAWLSYRNHWAWLLERVLGADLNGDGAIGQPQPPMLPAPHIRVDLMHPDGAGADWLKLPYPEKLPTFAETVLQGRTYSQAALVGSGRLFSRSEYDQLIDALIAAGLMRWKNPEHHNQGAVTTSAGRAVFKRLAEIHSPTQPDEDAA